MPSFRAPDSVLPKTSTSAAGSKRHILFVDDDELVLRSLERLLRRAAADRNWELLLAQDAGRASELLDELEIDVVVVDAHMPKVSGIVLLRQIQERHADVVRILLSGESGLEMLRSGLPHAHQFLAKPCDGAELCYTLENACALRDLLTNREIRQLVGSSNELPSPPRLYFELANALLDPRAGTRRIAEIVQLDIALSARVMQLVSSAVYGLPRAVISLSAAVAFLGVEVIRAIVLSIEVTRLFPLSLSLPEFSLEGLQQRAARVAHLARHLSPPNVDADLLLVSALLQDLGQLVLASRATQRFKNAISLSQSKKITLPQAELETFGVTHAEVGGYLLGLWGVSERVVRVVTHHLEPQRLRGREFDAPAILYLANHLVADPDVIATEPVERGARALDLEFLRFLGIASKLEQFRRLARDLCGASIPASV